MQYPSIWDSHTTNKNLTENLPFLLRKLKNSLDVYMFIHHAVILLATISNVADHPPSKSCHYSGDLLNLWSCYSTPEIFHSST
jgi:hypothetical protein